MSSAWVTRLECPKGVKDEVKQTRRAKRVAEGHQLEIGAQRAPRFLVIFIFVIIVIFVIIFIFVIFIIIVLIIIILIRYPRTSSWPTLRRFERSSLVLGCALSCRWLCFGLLDEPIGYHSLQAHDVVAHEVYGEEAVRVTPPSRYALYL